MSTTTETAAESTIPAGPWQGFAGGRWQQRIDVRDFIQANYTPYTGDAAFLAGPTGRTTAPVVAADRDVPGQERARGVYDVDARTPASITATPPATSTGSTS